MRKQLIYIITDKHTSVHTKSLQILFVVVSIPFLKTLLIWGTIFGKPDSVYITSSQMDKNLKQM